MFLCNSKKKLSLKPGFYIILVFLYRNAMIQKLDEIKFSELAGINRMHLFVVIVFLSESDQCFKI